MAELQRRLAAICQHYGIPTAELEGWLCVTSSNEFPLQVAHGYRDLERIPVTWKRSLHVGSNWRTHAD